MRPIARADFVPAKVFRSRSMNTRPVGPTLYNGYYGRGLTVAVGPTLYNGCHFHGLNVTVGQTLDQRLKASANLGQCANVSPTKILLFKTINLHVSINISNF